MVPGLWWLTVNGVLALVVCVAVGWWFRRAPRDRLDEDGRLLALRAFESHGDWYQDRFSIKTWKDRLPETGGRRGGISKRALPSRDVDGLRLFMAECRRGELTHWALVAVSPMFLLWNTRRTGIALTALGAGANLPFIMVLRYNRARIGAMLERRAG